MAKEYTFYIGLAERTKEGYKLPTKKDSEICFFTLNEDELKDFHYSGLKQAFNLLKPRCEYPIHIEECQVPENELWKRMKRKLYNIRMKYGKY